MLLSEKVSELFAGAVQRDKDTVFRDLLLLCDLRAAQTIVISLDENVSVQRRLLLQKPEDRRAELRLLCERRDILLACKHLAELLQHKRDLCAAAFFSGLRRETVER